MAEENADPITTAVHEELNSLNVVNNSAGSSVSDSTLNENHVHQLRSSIDSYQKSPNKSQQRIPNYLRASTGSCHDLCKYGKRTVFEEEKPWKTTRRPAKSSLSKSNSVELTTSNMKKKEKFGSEGSKERMSSQGNGGVQIFSNTPKLKTSSNLKSCSIGKGKNASSGKEAYRLRTLKSSPIAKSSLLDPHEIIKKEITAEKTLDQSLKLLHSSSESKDDKVRLSSLSCSLDGTVMKGRRNPDAKTDRTMTSSRDFGKKVSAPVTTKVVKLNRRNKADIKDNKVSEKTLHVVKIGSSNTQAEPITDERDIAPLQSSQSNVEEHSSSLLAHEEGEGTKGIIINESEGTGPNVPVKEKQIKTSQKSRKLAVSGDKCTSLGKSKLASGKAVDPKKLQSRSGSTILIKGDKSLKKTEEHSLKEKPKRILKKSGFVISEDKHLPPVRLRFRSGKVVNVPQDNSNVPRRLKFRRPKPIGVEPDKSLPHRNEHESIGNAHDSKEKEGNKLLRKNKVVAGDEEKVTAPVRIYRSGKSVDPPTDNEIGRRLRFKKVRIPRIEGGGRGDSRIRTFRATNGEGTAIGTEISGKKMALKHQSVQSKKDARVLLNNVIEETASKLVESRKSKVKALVGAFETVISLHEGKAR